jgi:hypothetical protein
MSYQVACFENVTHGDRFEEYRPPTSLLSYVGTFRIQAESPLDAAEQAYAIGNKTGAEDADFRTWPLTRRSMSVGDLILVDGVPMECDRIGWVTLDSIQPDQGSAPPPYEDVRSSFVLALESAGVDPEVTTTVDDYVDNHYDP